MDIERLVLIGASMGIPPWGMLVWVSLPLGVAGLVVQGIGVALIVYCIVSLLRS